MRRPKISVDNYKAVYDYYRQNELSERSLRLAHAAINSLLHPRVSLAQGAADDLNRISEQQLPHIYIFNHLSRLDWLVFAATVQQITPDDVGKIRTIGADFNFRWLSTKSKLWMGVGNLCDYIGGIPVFRGMEYGDRNLRPVQEELFNCLRDCLANGQKIAAAPEGKINETDHPETLLKFHSGIAEVACRAATLLNKPSAITSIGMWYDSEHHLLTKATDTSVYVERALFVPPASNPRAITHHARTSLQHAVTIAKELY